MNRKSQETSVTFRLFSDVRDRVKDIVSHNAKYQNESHFYRAAAMKLINEEEAKFMLHDDYETIGRMPCIRCAGFKCDDWSCVKKESDEDIL